MNFKIVSLLIILMLSCHKLIAQQVGMASYYAKNIRNKMANGQRYHKDSMFCAHRTHPFGTKLKITHLRNHKSIIVKVTDRGPFGRGRVVDISWGAAEKLGMVAAGVAKVKVEVFRGEIDSEIDTHPNDSTDLLIDYADRDYELPFMPIRKEKKGTSSEKKPTKPSTVKSTKKPLKK